VICDSEKTEDTDRELNPFLTFIIPILMFEPACGNVLAENMYLFFIEKKSQNLRNSKETKQLYICSEYFDLDDW